jgi:geranylgeranyl transferase type-2 subunit alpha
VVEDETNYAFGLINKNFSNYSAWHFRAKLMPKFENFNNIKYNTSYVIPVDQISQDLATLKHAYFTQPKDQSPWAHH